MSALGSAITLVTEKVSARWLAARVAGETVPITPIAVYFADEPSSLYQLRRWYRSLAALNAVHPVVIITSAPATYRVVREESGLTVAFAYGTQQLGAALQRRGVRVVLYPNHNALNFRMLRFAAPVHVFIGHGESAKDSSVSRQLKAYDFTFVADESSIDQLRGIRGFDATAAAIVVGSPWLDFLPDPPASWKPDNRTVVLYAPTWEGDRPTMEYGSVESHGETVVASILAAPQLRLIYRPHPWLGRVRKESADADARIRASIRAAGRSDLVDTGEYGWVLDAADVCITDVSSVAHDWRASGKPLFVTVPASAIVGEIPADAYRDATQVTVAEAPEVAALVRADAGADAARDAVSRPRDAGTPAGRFIEGVTTVIEFSEKPIT